MEHHAQSVEDALIGGLSYKLKPGASYVTNRRSVSFMASGGNQYSPAGVKVIRFNITADQWLDPSTFRVMFQLNNLAAGSAQQYIKPLHWNPAVFFRRARLIAGGQVIEDIDDFNRLSIMLTALKPAEEQLDIANDGFGNYDVFEEINSEDNDERKFYREGDFNESGVVQFSRKVLFKPMLGLFNQDKLLPLRYCPLQIELELVNNGSDSVFIGAIGAIQCIANWEITDAQCKCDLLTLDSSLENEYASHLLSGKTLPINFSSWNHTNQSTNQNKDFNIHVSRALTRLKSVCITLHRNDEDWYKVCNNFYHPMGAHTGNQKYWHAAEHQVWVQVGSKLMPEYPVNSITEAYYQLKKVVGRAFNIHSRWYRSRRYIVGFDLEKISGAGFTGVSTKNGDLLTVNFRHCIYENEDGTLQDGSQPQRMYCALNYDAILNIRDQGVELLD